MGHVIVDWALEHLNATKQFRLQILSAPGRRLTAGHAASPSWYPAASDAAAAAAGTRRHAAATPADAVAVPAPSVAVRRDVGLARSTSE